MLTIDWAAVLIAGRSTAITPAAAAARPTASTTQLMIPSPRSSRSSRVRSRFQIVSSSISFPPFSALGGLGEEVQEPVREQQNKHGEERRDRCVHRQVGALGRPLEVTALLGARLSGLLAEEVEVGAFLCRKQLGEAAEARLAALACDLDERLTLGQVLVAAGERKGTFE